MYSYEECSLGLLNFASEYSVLVLTEGSGAVRRDSLCTETWKSASIVVHLEAQGSAVLDGIRARRVGFNAHPERDGAALSRRRRRVAQKLIEGSSKDFGVESHHVRAGRGFETRRRHPHRIKVLSGARGEPRGPLLPEASASSVAMSGRKTSAYREFLAVQEFLAG